MIVHPSLEEKVDFLGRAETYPGESGPIEIIETHMSWVFLTSRHAFKMKKPVRYEYLDFSTLEARRFDCSEEVRLNRRLAGETYLGVVPVVATSGGELGLEQEGEVVEWLVKMNRLPADRMLDHLIRAGTITRQELTRVGDLLSGFYGGLMPLPLDPAQHLFRLRKRLDQDLEELLQESYRLDRGRVEKVGSRLKQFLDAHREELEERVRSGKVVEGHGDLRPEHICLLDRPLIIDCLEFEPEFRVLDPVDELSFLALECEALGAPEMGAVPLQVYQEICWDRFSPRLVSFYKARRALLRAKLAIWHTRDPEYREQEQWHERAESYLELAECHGRELR